MWLFVLALLLVAVTACKTTSDAATPTTTYAVCKPDAPPDQRPIGEGIFTAGAQLIGAPDGLEVPIFTIQRITPEGVHFEDIGLVPEGALVVIDTNAKTAAPQFRVIALDTDETPMRALVATYDVEAARVACTNPKSVP